jgi:signal transduction histidine kinase
MSGGAVPAADRRGDRRGRLGRVRTLLPAADGIANLAATSATGGHGLGLAIVRAIAGAHGATLTAAARPEGGLDVAVSFPSPR